MLINGQKARKLMDRIILEAGNSLYPVSVSVSSRMEITGINNLSEIRSRWRECTQRLTEKYPSPYTNAYLSASSQNLSDEKAFIASLYNDSFFNVYFRNIFSPLPAGEGVLIKWKNFPEKDMETSCLYVIENAGSNKILTLGQVMEIISGSRGEYRMEYKIGDKKEIHAIKGEITSLYNDKKYIKQISVKTDKIITAFPMVEIQVTED